MMKILKAIILSSILFTLGCAESQKSKTIDAVPVVYDCDPSSLCIYVLSPDLDKYKEMWYAEVIRRFKNPVLVIGHGGVDKNDVWVQDDLAGKVTVESLAVSLHHLYPKRDVVLVVCNPKNADLHVDRVWYAHGLVWSPPSLFAEHDGAGTNDIDDFMENGDSKTSYSKFPNFPYIPPFTK